MADASREDGRRRGRLVLVVEDDVGTQMLIVEAAREAGFGAEVRVVRTATEALALLQRTRDDGDPAPSLVLLDIHLPDGSGLDLLRTVRALPTLRAIPVVVFSGSTDPLDIASAYEAGANGYAAKPMRFQELTAVLKSTLDYWVNVNEPLDPAGRY